MNSWDTPAAPGGTARRQHRGLRNAFVIVAALLILLIVADRLAVVIAQNKVASEIQNQGFDTKPSVSIKGFPFLTQVLAHNIHEVQVTSPRLKAGPITVRNLDADVTSIKMNGGFSAGTIGHLTGKALIPFGGVSSAISSSIGGGDIGSLLGSGLSLHAAGNHEVRASIDLAVVSGSATLRVTRLSGSRLRIQLVSSHGLPSQITDQLKNLTVPIPKLPLGMKIQRVSVTTAGIAIGVTGHDVKFGS
jgi:LmeA-like phospholipid-binding